MKNKQPKELNKMNKKELLDVVHNLIAERTFSNEVSIADVSVSSSVETLDKCIHAVNSLIEKNKEFITLRNHKLKSSEQGFYG